MKILELDYGYYYYPQGINCIEEFVNYLNENYNSFFELTLLNTENCCYPYFIEEEVSKVYRNVSNIGEIREVEATVLSRLDYDVRLEQVVKEKCINCVNYEEGKECDNLRGHREKLTLDGECWGYEKKSD